MAVINNFGGGIVTGIDEYYLGTNHASVLVNADVSKIGLIHVPTGEQVKACQKWFYQYPIEDTSPQEFFVCSSANYRSYAEFSGMLCYSNGGPHCRYTYGEKSAEDGIDDFIWYDMGTVAVDGKIKARPIVLSDLAGASATIKSQVGGFINIEHVKYRVVNTASQTETIYIKDFKDNPGGATVDWVVPSDTKVYRELVNEWDEPVGRFFLVNQNDETTFTDGLESIFYSVECERNTTVDNRASDRLAFQYGKTFTLHYKVENTIEIPSGDETSSDDLDKSNVYVTTCTVDTLFEVLDDRYIPLNLQNKFVKEVRSLSGSLAAIASLFVINNQMFIMITVGSSTGIYHVGIQELIYETHTVDVPFEFHRGSTAVAGNSIYFFDPKGGKVGFFNGTFMATSSMPVFPYATASTSVFSAGNGLVYAILNNADEANLYAFTLPGMVPYLTGKERIRLDRIQSLGGTTGSVMYDGDYIMLPIERKILRYNPDTHEIKELKRPEIYPSGSVKGFTYSDLTIKCVSKNVIAVCTKEFKDLPDELDIKHLTGSYLYNVSQKTSDPTPIDGPIMVTEHDEVEIEYGHMRVDLSGITHTNELRLYRTGGYLTRYTMIDDVDPTDLYIDRKDDVTIALGREGVYDHVTAPPEGIQWLTSHKGRLFGAVGNKIYWSELGQANYWDNVLNMLVVDRDVTGLASGFNGLIIFMKGSMQLLADSQTQQMVLKSISRSHGTTKSYSVQEAGGGALFFSSDGLCFTDGITVKDLSYDVLGGRDFTVLDSAVTAKSYYALIENFMNSNHQFILLRQDINKEPMFTSIDAAEIRSIGTIDGELAHQYEGFLYLTFGGEGARTLSYQSGKLSLGELTMVKEWDRVRVTGEFIGVLTLTIDERIVLSGELNTATSYNVHIPKDKNKGKTMTINIEGTGDIYSIEYSITGRSTTK